MTSEQAPLPGVAVLPLLVALLLMSTLTVLPGLLADANGHADHPAALLMFWSMSAGFVRGVGFIPRLPALRWLLSGPACALALGTALLRLATRGGLPFFF